MRILANFAAAVEQINEKIGQAVSWLTLFVVLNVFIVVVLRYVFSIGYVWMQELYVWVHASVFLIAAAYTLGRDGHVRIDLVYREASKKYKATINLLGSLFLGLPLMWVLFWKALPIASRSFDFGEKSSEVGGLPGLYLLKATIVIFALLMGLQLLAIIARSVLTLFDADEPRESAS